MCLLSLLRRYRITCCYEALYSHLYNQMTTIELSQLPKVFKFSLAHRFSTVMSQERPKSESLPLVLFPRGIQAKIDRLSIRRTRKCKFYWDLLQCKDLAATVPKSMIQGSYEKHRQTLSAVGVTPQKVLNEFRDRMREFCEVVRSNFKWETSLPPRRAYFSSKFSEGGCYVYHKKLGHIKSQNHEYRWDGDVRIDPVVFHLHGKPGVGKSLLSTYVAKRLSQRFGYKESDRYDRSVATKHWDGYRGQLIASIDDLFCLRQDDSDASEIIQICSNVDYVLPMADLKEKGRKFVSDFLFLSSNNPDLAGQCTVTNMGALRRRIYPSYELLTRMGNDYRVQKHIYNVETGQVIPGKILTSSLSGMVDLIVDDLLRIHRDRSRRDKLRFPIGRSGSSFEPGISIEFPTRPPPRLPKVMAHAIPEPLKVRMITKGEEDIWILKPVQKAMWKSLQSFPCFQLTGCPDIPFDFMKTWRWKPYLLSGDYEAATDNLNMDIMQVAIDELAKVLPDSLSDWLRWEGGAHEVHYPPSSGLQPILQTRGQLMGSLLSFPVLCVANATTIGMVKRQNLSDLQALINGDDILFQENLREIRKWKQIASSMGLSPSIGKNYQSKDFGSINSQLLFRSSNHRKVEFTTVRTGCFGAIQKTDRFLSNFRLALELEPHNKGTFVLLAKDLLRRTCESIDIPKEFGGIGFSFDKEPSLLDKEIYFFKLLKKTFCKVLSLEDQAIYRIPKASYMKYKGVLGLRQVPEPTILPELGEREDLQVFPFSEFRKFLKFYKKNPYLRERIRGSDLKREVPLNIRSFVTVSVPLSKSLGIENLRVHL